MSEVFRKTGPPSAYEMFAAEAEGLAELQAAGALRVPAVLDVGVDDRSAWIELEKLNLAPATDATRQALGERLAELHRTTGDRFGWHRDNTIGLTPQINTRSGDWIAFLREHRLGFQFRLAADNGYGGRLQVRGEQLMRRLPVWFEGYEPRASLLHGDLWGGNWGSCGGEPVVFDPAVYYGDRESDLAMTRLFGGFGQSFYDAYESAWPLSPGHRERCDVYQLYHVLNHLNLFGSGYLGRAQELLERLLRG